MLDGTAWDAGIILTNLSLCGCGIGLLASHHMYIHTYVPALFHVYAYTLKTHTHSQGHVYPCFKPGIQSEKFIFRQFHIVLGTSAYKLSW